MMGTGYTEHDVDTYDDRFQAVPEIRRDPWAGKSYDKTRIMILGASIYYEEGEDDWGEIDGRLPNRILAYHHGMGIDKTSGPFPLTTQMFAGGANRACDEEFRKVFWESVAFANFCQKSVVGHSGRCSDRKNSHTALMKTLEILEPKVCIAWGVELRDTFMLEEEKRDYKQIDGGKQRMVQPRIAETPHGLVVGILHPSVVWRFHPKEDNCRDYREKWLDYLCHHSPQKCKDAVGGFLDHLKAA